jgi:hypothetical protein
VHPKPSLFIDEDSRNVTDLEHTITRDPAMEELELTLTTEAAINTLLLAISLNGLDDKKEEEHSWWAW